jgi:uncharacterized protein YndB with AHSA1/START domain
METMNRILITVQSTVHVPTEKVWKLWTDPKHITSWYQASADWHAPYAENNLMQGGRFKTTMAAKDGSFSFDFEGVYTRIEEQNIIEYTLDDGRKVKTVFVANGNTTAITQTFEAESSHSEEMQRSGWQAILDNFKKYAEAQNTN